MTQNLPNHQEKLLKKYQSRQGRKKADFYIVEGLRCCQEAFRFNNAAVRCVISTSKEQLLTRGECSYPLYYVNEAKFESLSMTENAQGMMILMDKPLLTGPTLEDPFLLLLDGLQEPGNMGTILRTALAVGLREVALTKGTVDPYNPKAVRAGMGAQFKLKITQVDSLESMQKDPLFHKKKFWLTTPHDGLSCYDDTFDLKNSVLVFGEEGGGIKDLQLGDKVTVPMPGEAESLNVAQAATLFLFEGVRRGLL